MSVCVSPFIFCRTAPIVLSLLLTCLVWMDTLQRASLTWYGLGLVQSKVLGAVFSRSKSKKNKHSVYFY